MLSIISQPLFVYGNSGPERYLIMLSISDRSQPRVTSFAKKLVGSTFALLSLANFAPGPRPALAVEPSAVEPSAVAPSIAKSPEKSAPLSPNKTAEPGVSSSAETQPLSVEVLNEAFKGYTACFVEAGPDHKNYVMYNPELAKERLSPCSTFKIPNSLIGLETGVLKDENHPMKWDGVKHQIEAWNQDQTLQSAVTNSVVWYFQNEATLVGKQRMQHYLNLINYGNKDISGGLTTFWLDSSLKISANEQVDFIERLERSKLPFSQRSIDITKKLILLKTTDKGELHGKTGSGRDKETKGLGWFVGYVIHDGKPYYFATNIQGPGAWGPKAREMTIALLTKQGLL
jgi:bla regulator protein BlaR1